MKLYSGAVPWFSENNKADFGLLSAFGDYVKYCLWLRDYGKQ